MNKFDDVQNVKEAGCEPLIIMRFDIIKDIFFKLKK